MRRRVFRYGGRFRRGHKLIDVAEDKGLESSIVRDQLLQSWSI